MATFSRSSFCPPANLRLEIYFAKSLFCAKILNENLFRKNRWDFAKRFLRGLYSCPPVNPSVSLDRRGFSFVPVRVLPSGWRALSSGLIAAHLGPAIRARCESLCLLVASCLRARLLGPAIRRFGPPRRPLGGACGPPSDPPGGYPIVPVRVLRSGWRLLPFGSPLCRQGCAMPGCFAWLVRPPLMVLRGGNGRAALLQNALRRHSYSHRHKCRTGNAALWFPSARFVGFAGVVRAGLGILRVILAGQGLRPPPGAGSPGLPGLRLPPVGRVRNPARLSCRPFALCRPCAASGRFVAGSACLRLALPPKLQLGAVAVLRASLTPAAARQGLRLLCAPSDL